MSTNATQAVESAWTLVDRAGQDTIYVENVGRADLVLAVRPSLPAVTYADGMILRPGHRETLSVFNSEQLYVKSIGPVPGSLMVWS